MRLQVFVCQVLFATLRLFRERFAVTKSLFIRKPACTFTLFFCLALGFTPLAGAQTNSWTWMGGFSTVNQAGGPDDRTYAVTWTDNSGNSWVFGGTGYDSSGLQGALNDLWKFDPTLNYWAQEPGDLIGGTSVRNQPGVYGTLGTPSASNLPGGRSGAMGWVDSAGNLWMFGGQGYDANGTLGFLNDLWKYDPSTGQWTWEGGSDTVPSCTTVTRCGPAGVYGTKGTPSASNIPGGRAWGSVWKDSSGNVWLFGGKVTFTSLNGWGGYINDLWKLDTTSGEWTWMGGDNTIPSCSVDCGEAGVYGTLKSAAANNLPGARARSVSWTDKNGNLWLFGGLGFDSSDTFGELNDLWEFNAATNQWMWFGGADAIGSTYGGATGVYGTWRSPGEATLLEEETSERVGRPARKPLALWRRGV